MNGNKNKIPLIINDLVIHEDICNSNCEYCLLDGSKLKSERTIVREDGVLQFKKKDKNTLSYSKGSIFYEKLNRMLDIMEENFDIPILKISGGEIFLVNGIIDLFEDRASHYTVLQALTNGTLLNEEKVARMAEIKNLQVQFPLDGHTLDMNQCRVGTEKFQERLLRNLDLLIKYHIPVEINCVLTKRNISNITDYLDFMLKYAGKLTLFFLPVRFKPAQDLFPSKEQIKDFHVILDNYDKYSSILPPRVYIDEVYKYMNNFKRELSCAIPLTIIQSFDDGFITPCANRWTTVMGNLLEDEPKKALDQFNNSKIYDLLLNTNEKEKVYFCKKCFTPYDILNFYLTDMITVDELNSLKLFNSTHVNQNLLKIKESMKEDKPRREINRIQIENRNFS
jgi:MoaA/NifB/PqqE/SkfB family radical SAM enzyme